MYVAYTRRSLLLGALVPRCTTPLANKVIMLVSVENGQLSIGGTGAPSMNELCEKNATHSLNSYDERTANSSEERTVGERTRTGVSGNNVIEATQEQL